MRSPSAIGILAVTLLLAAPAHAELVGGAEFVSVGDSILTFRDGDGWKDCDGLGLSSFDTLGEDSKVARQWRLRVDLVSPCLEEPLHLEFTETDRCRFAAWNSIGLFAGCSHTITGAAGATYEDAWVPFLTDAWSVMWITVDRPGPDSDLMISGWMKGAGFIGGADLPIEPISDIVPHLPRAGEVVHHPQL